MIYLARNGKCFGPFSTDELTPELLSEYSWILDTRSEGANWMPVDPAPNSGRSGADAASKSGSHEAIVTGRDSRAVSGTIQKIRLRSGVLVTEESSIRLEPGSIVDVVLCGSRPFPAVVEQVEFRDRKARYALGWAPRHAPG